MLRQFGRSRSRRSVLAVFAAFTVAVCFQTTTPPPRSGLATSTLGVLHLDDLIPDETRPSAARSPATGTDDAWTVRVGAAAAAAEAISASGLAAAAATAGRDRRLPVDEGERDELLPVASDDVRAAATSVKSGRNWTRAGAGHVHSRSPTSKTFLQRPHCCCHLPNKLVHAGYSLFCVRRYQCALSDIVFSISNISVDAVVDRYVSSNISGAQRRESEFVRELTSVRDRVLCLPSAFARVILRHLSSMFVFLSFSVFIFLLR